MEEILHQLISSLSHSLQGFTHPRWCRISSINNTTPLDQAGQIANIQVGKIRMRSAETLKICRSTKAHCPRPPLAMCDRPVTPVNAGANSASTFTTMTTMTTELPITTKLLLNHYYYYYYCCCCCCCCCCYCSYYYCC